MIALPRESRPKKLFWTNTWTNKWPPDGSRLKEEQDEEWDDTEHWDDDVWDDEGDYDEDDDDDYLDEWDDEEDDWDDDYEEDDDDEPVLWNCNCGMLVDGYDHCPVCGSAPPWGCDCPICQEELEADDWHAY